MERDDIDADVLAHYVESYGEEPPVLAVGDRIAVPGLPDLYPVVDFAAGGMLVVAVHPVTGQEFHFPRRFQPMRGESVYLAPRDDRTPQGGGS